MSDPAFPWQHHRPWRNNNPGDLRPRHNQPQWPGMHDTDNNPGGPFAMFVTPADGWCALALWLMYAHDVMGMKTTTQKIEVFAPPSENDTVSYAAGVAAKVGDNANPHDPLARVVLCKAIAHWEDYQAAWPDDSIVAGMRLADARWPAFLEAVSKG